MFLSFLFGDSHPSGENDAFLYAYLSSNFGSASVKNLKVIFTRSKAKCGNPISREKKMNKTVFLFHHNNGKIHIKTATLAGNPHGGIVHNGKREKCAV